MSTDTERGTYFSIFRPTITVHDGGKVEIDFADTYENTYDEDGGVASTTNAEADMALANHTDILDALVAEKSAVEALRALADYIENDLA